MRLDAQRPPPKGWPLPWPIGSADDAIVAQRPDLETGQQREQYAAPGDDPPSLRGEVAEGSAIAANVSQHLETAGECDVDIGIRLVVHVPSEPDTARDCKHFPKQLSDQGV